MRFVYFFLSLQLLYQVSCRLVDVDDEFTNEWAAEIAGGNDVARQVARDLGYDFHGQVSSMFQPYSHFSTSRCQPSYTRICVQYKLQLIGEMCHPCTHLC